jgi:signal transduction histidine kinase
MIPDERLLADLETSSSYPEHQRQQTVEKLGLLEPGTTPIFEEATQTAAHFLHAPICVLSILDRSRIWFKSAVGLSRIGLMNSLASSRQLPRQESFCADVVEKQRVLAVVDAPADPAFASMQLVQRYGICSYLGVPLFTAAGQCVGSLAVMELTPRTFSDQEIAFLELIARWSMSEYERNWLQQQCSTMPISPQAVSSSVKIDLISQMTQELCTPLTSILGMAKVLSQGIYGSLSDKQQEYLQIIHNSGQQLVALVNEIVELGRLDDQSARLTLSSIDIEMLCQQSIGSLSQSAQRYEQKIQLSVEPGSRIWMLDRDKVRQMLHHLLLSVIQSSSPNSIIRIHISRKQGALHIAIWCCHPWLGEGVSLLAANQASPQSSGALEPSGRAAQISPNHIASRNQADEWEPTASSTAAQPIEVRQNLGLVMSRQLASLHGGNLVIQGSSEQGYRYVIRLPQMQAEAASPR